MLVLVFSMPAAAAEPPVTPACFDELAAYSADLGIGFDAAKVEFGARWIGAGHEVRRVPGMTARIPVESCGAALAVDLSVTCGILKSRGEGACRKVFPLTFH